MDLNTIITGFHELAFGVKLVIWLATILISGFAGYMICFRRNKKAKE